MIAPLLKKYNQLVTDCRDLLEIEIAEYQAGRGGQDSSIHELKQDLIDQLGSRLGELKTARNTSGDSPMVNRSQINYLQQTFMQLLCLDRELERHLLVGNVRPGASEIRGLAQPSFAARIYRQNQMGMASS